MAIHKNMSLLEGLQQRVSHPRLEAPAPSAPQLAQAYQAAFRSPDHAWLRPWRFIECRNEERETLGELIATGLYNAQPAIEMSLLDKARLGPLRAPLVLVCYAKVVEHPKVPAVEQLIAVGCAINNMSCALYSMGYGSVWRTGESAYSSDVHRQLNLGAQDVIVGYLYVGTPMSEDKSIPRYDIDDYVVSLTNHLKG